MIGGPIFRYPRPEAARSASEPELRRELTPLNAAALIGVGQALVIDKLNAHIDSRKRAPDQIDMRGDQTFVQTPVSAIGIAEPHTGSREQTLGEKVILEAPFDR